MKWSSGQASSMMFYLCITLLLLAAGVHFARLVAL